MSEWICLRCDWAGEAEGAACPRCGVPLYRIGRPEPTDLPRSAPAVSPPPRRAGSIGTGSPTEVPGDDEDVPPPMPPTGRRWTAMVLALTVAAFGMAAGFLGRNGPDTTAASGENEEQQGAPSTPEAPAGEDLVGAQAGVAAGPEACPDGQGAQAGLAPSVGAGSPGVGAREAPIVLGPQPVVSAAVTADYRFQGSLASSVGTAPDLVLTGEGSTAFGRRAVLGDRRTVLRFAPERGLSLVPTGGVMDGGEYTIEVLFRLDRVDGWRKILDFKDAADDSGLYVLNGCLNFFPTVVAPRETIEAGSFVQVVLTRDASAEVVGYVDGLRQFTLGDGRRLAVTDASHVLRFFTDDSTTEVEDSSGAVSRIRLYDGPLTANEVAGLACAELPGATCRLTREGYLGRARGICGSATDAFDAAITDLDLTDLEDVAVYSEVAVRLSEDALGELYVLPPPEADRALLERDYRLRERELDVLRELAAAASAGDAALAGSLSAERLGLTHRRVLDEPGHLPWECPVALGA